MPPVTPPGEAIALRRRKVYATAGYEIHGPNETSFAAVGILSCVDLRDCCHTVTTDITYNRSLGVLAPGDRGVSDAPGHIIGAGYGGNAHEERKKRKRKTKAAWEG